MTVHPLLLAAPLLLVLLAAAGLLLLPLRQRRRELARRIEAVTAPFGPKRAAHSPGITRQDAGSAPSWPVRAASLFGFDPARADLHPLHWRWVLAGALALGLAASVLASGMLGPAAWLLAPAAWVLLSRSYFSWSEGRRKTVLIGQFPDALAMIVRAVRVGIPVPEALRAVSREAQEPTRAEFRRLVDQVSIGVPIEPALKEMAARNSLPEYGFFAATLGLQAQTGGGLTETLENLADVIRKRVAMRARGHALSSEARTSSLVLAALPGVSGGLLLVTNPGYMAVLVTEPTGRMLLGAAALSLATGMLAMRTIIRRTLA